MVFVEAVEDGVARVAETVVPKSIDGFVGQAVVGGSRERGGSDDSW